MLRLHNTLSGKKEEFQPLEEGHVRMYVCGPTVYSSSHLGHARPAVVFDTLRRYLEFSGYKVTYVTNFTDVDDKIIKRAQEENSTEEAISARYIDEYFEDMDALNVKQATDYPKATEHIQDMIELVQVLLDKGYAYKVGEGDVFFRVSKFAGYGKLSGRSLDEIKKARVEPDERKENPEDFALWKAAKPGEPSWETPWGKGRPGWHIECSAMSRKYLGPLPFDIHGGGKDLIFPHHENEIAQSEAAYNKPMARFWLHNGFINIAKEKMSKSIGNVFNLRNAYEQYPPTALRLFLLQTHYRTDISYTPTRLKEATQAMTTIVEAYERAEAFSGREPDKLSSRLLSDWKNRVNHKRNFQQAMDDDLNTAAGLAIVFGVVRQINDAVDEGEKERAFALREELGVLLDVLGLPKTREEALTETAKTPAAGTGDPNEALLNLFGETRALAREEKAFAVSDFIRERLAELGYEIRDLPDGKFEIKRRL